MQMRQLLFGQRLLEKLLESETAMNTLRNSVTLLDTDSAMRSRKTTKVLAEADLPVNDLGGLVEELLAAAAMAPFHRACDVAHRAGTDLAGIEPWRFYVVDAAGCRLLRQRIPRENAGKIPAMLAAADALLLTTWLPNPPSERFQLAPEAEFEPTLANMEHIAAASAAIQNLLLAATARGVASYWSSGGILRSSEVFNLTGIPANQILLGAVFLFPAEVGDSTVVGSKLRDKRCPARDWSRAVYIDNPV